MASAGVQDGFLPVVAPSSAVPIRIDEHYDTDEDFIFALADALNEEYRAVVDAGLYVQVDDAYMATMYDNMVPPATMSDYRAWAELRVEALKRALAGIPPERSRYHVCWGAGTARTARTSRCARSSTSCSRCRSAATRSSRPTRATSTSGRCGATSSCPPTGCCSRVLISHATNVLEHPELVAQRIVRLAELVGRERVIASTDCGFAQTPYITRVHPTLIWAKLEALVEGARLASERLWA